MSRIATPTKRAVSARRSGQKWLTGWKTACGVIDRVLELRLNATRALPPIRPHLLGGVGQKRR